MEERSCSASCKMRSTFWRISCGGDERGVGEVGAVRVGTLPLVLKGIMWNGESGIRPAEGGVVTSSWVSSKKRGRLSLSLGTLKPVVAEGLLVCDSIGVEGGLASPL